MTGALALSAMLLAVYGAAHCAAMCGGFVASTFTPASGSPARPAVLHRAALPMHAGRLLAYAAAGALAGALGAAPAVFLGSARYQAVLFSVGALVLVVTGLRIAGIRLVRPANALLAQPLWNWAANEARRLGAPDTLPKRLGLGVLWGCAPCAIVYSALPLALASGSATGGALVMLAFGAGTLPALVAAGWLIGRGEALFQGRTARRVAGLLIVVLALAGIAQALGVADTALGSFCVSAPH
ncbi:MAG TPA: sulfite exporter TauE/SafE family protein [Usitatibacteraceae bacterium]|nr:sulfite exporter TauE/SafE family protein [Usitatibacteraceae bacterium]